MPAEQRTLTSGVLSKMVRKKVIGDEPTNTGKDPDPRKKRSRHGPLRARSRPCRGTRFRWEELDLRFDCNIATISGRLGEGRELGIETKLCELGDETLGSHSLERRSK